MSPTHTTKPDVRSPEDVNVIIRSFYNEIENDPALGRFFAEVNWDAHLPRMTAFWSGVLFHTGEYRGRPFDPHARLEGLERMHFHRWIARFKAAVDDQFEGERADTMKQKAQQIASIFQMKLGLWDTIENET